MKEFNLEKFRIANLPSQEKIMSSWRDGEAKPVVSAICLTFNQEQYIEDAIRGFLIQATDFPFEIIIHDDASTDSTTEIIKRYASEYPKIIKPIFQKENQYSKSPNSVLAIATNKSSGKYIALCEGDDFWTSPQKLQSQIDLLERHPEVKICFHKHYEGKTDEGKKIFTEPYRSKLLHPRTERIIPINSIIIGGGDYIATASLVVTREIMEALPEWLFKCPIGDYFIQIIASTPQGALFIPKKMSFYRMFSHGSWSSQKRTPEKNLLHTQKMLEALQSYKNTTNNKSPRSIEIISKEIQHYFLSKKENIEFLKKNETKINLNPRDKRLKKINTKHAPIYKALHKLSKLKRYLILSITSL